MIGARTYITVELEDNVRPSDRLRRWVESYRSSYVAKSIGAADYRVVLTWVRSRNSRPPVLKNVKAIIGLSQQRPLGIGPLSYEDFFGQVAVKSVYEHAVRKSMTASRQVPTRRAI
jgi:hypothetical protein